MMKGSGTRFADILLIGGLLAASLLWLFVSRADGTEGGMAVVAVNGQETGRYPLDTEGEFALNGGTNILVIEDGKARLSEADCPDKLCVRQGEIYRTGQTVTCLPNRLTVTIEGKKGEADLYLP